MNKIDENLFCSIYERMFIFTFTRWISMYTNKFFIHLMFTLFKSNYNNKYTCITIYLAIIFF